MNLSRRTLLGTSLFAAPTSAALMTLSGGAAFGAVPTWKQVYGQAQGGVFVVRAAGGKAGRRPVVLFHHGAGGTAKSVRDKAASVGQRQIINNLANAGYLVLVSDFGGDLFGNDLDHRYMNDLIGVGRRHGGRDGRVALVGVSMGGGASLSFAGNFPSKVACVAGVIPAMDLLGLSNLLPSYVDPPYGGYDNKTDGPRHSPLVMASRRHVNYPTVAAGGMFSAMPIALWYATEDVVCTPEAVAKFTGLVRSRVNSNLVTYPVVGPHSEEVITAVPEATLTAFVRKYLPV